MLIGLFFGLNNLNTVWKLLCVCSKVTIVTLTTLKVTFKGHTYIKICNFASCMLNGMFFGSRKPNFEIKSNFAQFKCHLF